MYSGDHDDVLPLANTWMDATDPYVTDPDAYRSPAVAAPGYGFAFAAPLAGASVNVAVEPESVVLLFDSTVLGRNATAELSTEVSPGRYGGRNVRAYLDGHIGDEPIAPTLDNSLNRVRRLSVAASLYSSDWDDFLPGTNWMDATRPYVGSDRPYRSPIFENTDNYGYALNLEVAGLRVTAIEVPSTAPGIFDSTALGRNAVAAPDTRPSPSRYAGGNAVGFVDGHAEARNP